MKSFIKELVLLILAIAPIVYLILIYQGLSPEIPLHYNFKGEIDRTGSKSTLIWLIPSCTLLTYLLMLLIPIIDPKKRILNDGNNYYAIRIIILAFISAIMFFFLHGLADDRSDVSFLSILLMIFVVLFGNYMPRLKPNYFVGIRTPWTLENPEVWTKTHRFSGRLWMICGSVVLMIYIIFSDQLDLALAIVTILTLAIISILYSYVQSRNLQ